MWPWSAEKVSRACGAGFANAAATPGEILSRVVHGAVTDSRKIFAGCLFVAIKGETFDGHDFVGRALSEGAAIALVDANWTGKASLSASDRNRCLVAQDGTTAAFRRLAGALRAQFPFPVVGIGGSNGKTTTKEMLAALLAGGSGGPGFEGRKITRTEKSENGFLGVAITLAQNAHSSSRPPNALVLEIGIDDVGAMREHVALCAPDVVLLTALGPEHLTGLGTWDTAVKEECDLFFTGSPRMRVWQMEDERLREQAHRFAPGDVLVGSEETISRLMEEDKLEGRPSVLTFSIAAANATKTEVVVKWSGRYTEPAGPGEGGFEATFVVDLPGLHNARNFALAAAVAAALGQDAAALEAGWATFVPPAMRSRIVTPREGVVLYDDSYNASPASMHAALESLANPQWESHSKALVLGDMLDLGGESKKWHEVLQGELTAFAQTRRVHLCLHGEAMYDVYRSLFENTLSQKNFVTLNWLPAEADPRVWVKDLLTLARPAVVLVKGSRGMGLDRFAKAFEDGDTLA